MGYYNDLSLRTMSDPKEQEQLDQRDGMTGLSRRRSKIVRPDYGKVLRDLEQKRAEVAAATGDAECTV